MTATYAAWALIVLGALHVIFGLMRFRTPLRAALSEGLIGRFSSDESRRLAFWFILTGPLLLLIGQLALRAAEARDLGAIQLIGFYLLGVGIIGVALFPKSPLWSILPVGAALIAAGLGWVA